jgi:hypothetical protein
LGRHLPKLLESFRDELRVRRYAPRTGKTDESWIRRLIRFDHLHHPREMGTAEILQFLTHLVVVRFIYGTGLRIEKAMMTRVSDGWGKVLPPGRNELTPSHDTTKWIFYLPHGGGACQMQAPYFTLQVQ